MKQAVLIGCGKMGGALLSQWARSEDYAFTVIDPIAADVPAEVTLYGDVSELGAKAFDMIVVAVKPQMIDEVLPAYKDRLAPGGVLVSMAAGYALERYGAHLPDAPCVRIMPNLPAAIGKGVTGLVATSSVTEAQKAAIDGLLHLAGRTLWVDREDALDRITAIAGSGPGYVFEIARQYVAAARTLGFSESEARDLVLGSMAGAVEMADASEESLETLRNNVTSKNGVTQAGLDQLRRGSELEQLLTDTVQAAYDRAVELR